MTPASFVEAERRIAGANRDALARIADNLGGGTTLDEALRIVLFHYESLRAIERLADDPQALAEYQREAQALADVDTEITGW